MNMFFTKWACHATSMMKRILRRVFALAPQKVSITKSFLLESSFVAIFLSSFHASSLTGLLSFLYSSLVHQMVSRVVSSITKNLSLGERPVYSPVITFTAPVSVSWPRS